MPDSADISVQVCECGLKIRYGPKHAGKTVRCKKCGEAITLGAQPKPTIDDFLADDKPVADPSADTGEYGLAPADIKMPSSVPLGQHHARHLDASGEATRHRGTREHRESQIRARRADGFWLDAFRGFTFWMNVDSALTLVVLTVLLVIADFSRYVPLAGFFTYWGIQGLVLGFYFRVVANSAGGDDDLPDVGEFDGVFDSILVPIGTVLGITIAVLLPAVVALMFGASRDWFIALLCAGIFFWPVAVLLSAVMGGLSMFRFDVMLMTIARAFPQYIMIWLLLIVAVAANFVAFGAGVGALPDSMYEAVDNLFFWSVVGSLSSAYMTIVVMRTIGLYYRYYSDRFPWSAG